MRRHAVIIFIAFAAFTVVQTASASTFDSNELSDFETERLIQARSLKQVRATVELKNELSLARATCQSELRIGGVPASCFQTIALEEKEKLLDQVQAARSKALMTETCKSRVGRVGSLEMLEHWLASEWVTQSCREAIRIRVSEVRYMASGQQPELLFQRRFR